MTVRKSDDIAELGKALAKAQAKIQGAHRDSANPFFKSKYADLNSIWDACREPLTTNGLSVTQLLSNGAEGQIVCTTWLIHESGQFLGSELAMMPTKNDPQGGGSCATYLRRYMLQSIVGVAPADDDANEASGKFPARTTTPGGQNDSGYTTRKTVAPAVTPNVPTQAQATNIPAAAPVVESFAISNPRHKEYFDLFVKTHKAEAFRDKLIIAMSGKKASTATLETEWAKINPETPDKDPEEIF